MDISRTKKKKDYNTLQQSVYEEELNYGVREVAKDMIALTKSTRGINVRVPSEINGAAMITKRIQEPDNVIRFNAVSEIGEVFGVKAPKQVDLKHSMAAMSDEELQREIDKSVAEITENENIQRQVAGSFSPGAVVTSTIIAEESTVAVDTRK